MTTLELQGIKHELAFWQGFVKTDRFLKGWVANIKTPELNNSVADFILSVTHDKVLDVGSGVVSILNGLVPVRAVDPLGGLYELIFDYKKYGVTPPIALPAEEIPFHDDYDIVHCSNAIDHSQEPFDGIFNLFQACKTGGYVILQGFTNEATHEKHAGFHQYNVDIDHHGLSIDGDKTGKRYVANGMYGLRFDSVRSEVVKLQNGREWYIWIAKKL